MSIFTDLTNRAIQQVGSSIDILGRSLNNPLKDWGLSEKLVAPVSASTGQTLGKNNWTQEDKQNSYDQNQYIPQANVVFPGQGNINLINKQMTLEQ
jgi:hypothetical protein